MRTSTGRVGTTTLALLAPALVCLMSVPTFAQRRNTRRAAPAQAVKCKLNLSQAPKLRGFYLGMTLDDVLARYAGLLAPKGTDRYGKSIINFEVRSGGDKDLLNHSKGAYINVLRYPEFDGVSLVRLTFINFNVSEIRVSYRDPAHWDSHDDFAATVAKQLKLTGAWQQNIEISADEFVNKTKTLNCKGFSATAGILYEPRSYSVGNALLPISAFIAILDVEAEAAAIDRARSKEADEKETKRKVFKP